MTESKIWTIVSVVRHDNGETTLTLRDEYGTTMTDTYPPGTTVNKVV